MFLYTLLQAVEDLSASNTIECQEGLVAPEHADGYSREVGLWFCQAWTEIYHDYCWLAVISACGR